MTIAPECLEALDFPAPDVLTEMHRELAQIMFAPGKALAIPHTETYEERMIREYLAREAERERLAWEQHRMWMDQWDRIMDLERSGLYGGYCYCSPSRGDYMMSMPSPYVAATGVGYEIAGPTQMSGLGIVLSVSAAILGFFAAVFAIGFIFSG